MGGQDNQNLNGAKAPDGKRRLIVAAVGVLVMLWMGVYTFNHIDRDERQMQYALEREAVHVARIRQEHAEREMEQEARRRVSDSIRRANAPRYSLDDVQRMVRARVPNYSWIYLWRRNNDDWIMQYKREYGGKEHWFMQRFNPTTRHFEPAREYATVSYRSDGSSVYTRLTNARCRFTENSLNGSLEYYEGSEPPRFYNREGIRSICRIPSTTTSPLAQQRIRALRSAPDYDDDEDDEDDDYDYDEDDDLYYYYGE